MSTSSPTFLSMVFCHLRFGLPTSRGSRWFRRDSGRWSCRYRFPMPCRRRNSGFRDYRSRSAFQQVDPFDLAPRLVVDVPAHAHGPRRREKVLRAENRRSVHAQAGIEQVAVAVGVVAVEIETRAAADTVGIARFIALLEALGERRILVQVAREAENLIAGVLLRTRTEIPAADGIDLVMAEKPAVGDRDIAVVAHHIGLSVV